MTDVLLGSHPLISVTLASNLLGTAQTTSTTGSNQTDLYMETDMSANVMKHHQVAILQGVMYCDDQNEAYLSTSRGVSSHS